MNKLIAAILLLAASVSSAALEPADDLLIEKERCLSSVGREIWVDQGVFVMGDDDAYPEEGPAHSVELDGFWIDVNEVTNQQFERFVSDTGYLTLAERTPDPAAWPDAPAAMRQPGSVVFVGQTDTEQADYWWAFLPGANWRHPEGPDSSIQGKDFYPVVHIAYEDALAYAEWAGRQLPTEAQLEYVAQAKLNTRVVGRDEAQSTPDKLYAANTWQGTFPAIDSGEDGYGGLAPVGCYPANAYGVYDLIGNVWEWTTNWYASKHNPEDSVNPNGPDANQSYSPDHGRFPVKVIKGGSYLCAPNYCKRYRPAARQAQDIGLGTNHLGFRTVLIPKRQ